MNLALADFNRAIEIKPDFAMAYGNRGSVRFALGDPTSAIADFDHAIQLNPRLVGAYQNRGLARLLQGRNVEADEDFAQCLELEPNLKPEIERLIKALKERMARR